MSKDEGLEFRQLLQQGYEILAEISRRLDEGIVPDNLEHHIAVFALHLDDHEIQRLCDANPPIDEKLFRYVIGRLNERLEQHLFKPVN